MTSNDRSYLPGNLENILISRGDPPWHLTCIHCTKRRVLCNSFYPLFFLLSSRSLFFFHEIFRFDHDLVIRKKIEEKLIAGREVRLVDRHGILTV